ncbi:hypothetical protein PPL_03079 [Heterostelium album PN500]|uniref:Thioredoxin n=1 Tax=Heterostelium pallidum (strain ATCC 26659 / Pp 5 / PN500) TaxID=670386 RepID=D3B3V8_HETP5|nr:hypothetical protein PPL_03079 [Heterostelium album PN500]EFA84006.1 hypothetical protein PPL_03079 [Heterostelium album PN500]|eukprot:XP_020436123.1 hypothetical protein PPL_03079 [Heterostelium album PN500]
MSTEILDHWKVVTECDQLDTEFTNCGSQLVVLYFGQPNCIGCEQIRGLMISLPAKYPKVKFLQIPSNSPVKRDHYCCNDMMVFPATRFYKNWKYPDQRDHLQIAIGACGSVIEDLIKQYQ